MCRNRILPPAATPATVLGPRGARDRQSPRARRRPARDVSLDGAEPARSTRHGWTDLGLALVGTRRPVEKHPGAPALGGPRGARRTVLAPPAAGPDTRLHAAGN